MKMRTMGVAEKLMRIEERTLFLGELVRINRGTKEVENFVRKQGGLRHEQWENMSERDKDGIIVREREIVAGAMMNKLRDNISKGATVNKEFLNLKGRLLWRIRREEEKKKFLHSMRDKVARKRQEVKRQHAHQVRAIRIEVKQEVKIRLPKELKRYKDCNIFKQHADKTFKPGTMLGPVMIGVENLLLDEDELSVLCKGPKFCIRRILSKERYLVEAEKNSAS